MGGLHWHRLELKLTNNCKLLLVLSCITNYRFPMAGNCSALFLETSNPPLQLVAPEPTWRLQKCAVWIKRATWQDSHGLLGLRLKALKRWSNRTLINCQIHSNRFSRLRALLKLLLEAWVWAKIWWSYVPTVKKPKMKKGIASFQNVFLGLRIQFGILHLNQSMRG